MSKIEIYADTRRQARCSGPTCGKTILFATVVKSGRVMPFTDPELVALSTRREEETNRLIETVDLAESHFGDCPDRQAFSGSYRSRR